MILRDVTHKTPTYTVPEIEQEQDVGFGMYSQRRPDTLKQSDQDQGRAGEAVFAKWLIDNYEKDWVWLDDFEESDSIESGVWEHDFIVETALGGATVDVKTRRMSDILQQFEDDPDFWTRFYATEDVQKTHIQNHIYVLVIINDQMPARSEQYSTGTVIGFLSGCDIRDAEEFEKNPDRVPIKYNLPSSEATQPSNESLEQVGRKAIEAFDEIGGFPSIADRLIESVDGNGIAVEEAISDEKYWSPKENPLSQTDSTAIDLTRNFPSKEISVDLTNQPLYYPTVSEETASIDHSEIQKFQQKGLSVMPLAGKIISNSPKIDADELGGYYAHIPFDTPRINANHVLLWWIRQIKGREDRRKSVTA